MWPINPLKRGVFSLSYRAFNTQGNRKLKQFGTAQAEAALPKKQA
jgi:hypothetical protein